jgi:hypothetical protein
LKSRCWLSTERFPRKLYLVVSIVATLLAIPCLVLASDHASEHEWLTGKVIDESRARYLAMIYHSGHSDTSTSGSVNATGQSTTTGDNTTTNIDGSYSGTSSTNYSGSDMPLYKVYENFIIEGDDMVYVTQERIRWRWSKSAHVTVNGEVKYYVDKRKLHVLDDDGKEHVIDIVKQIQKNRPDPNPQRPIAAQTPITPAISAEQATMQVVSTPAAADIEIDGKFVGSTPSTVGVNSGEHDVVVKKNGFTLWERKITVSSGHININAELTPQIN